MAAVDVPVPGTLPTVIGVRGARHNNLRDVDVDVPLWRTVAVVGVSGSGKTSLAMGTLYAEGMQRFLESLSTYSRRRLTQAQRPDVDRIDHLPPALALRQRPPIPGPRSTVGTMSEVLNVLRLMMSRLGSHLCPNGHRVAPSVATQAEEIVCPVCGARFEHPSAESFAFNSYGACPACQGLGVRSEVDVSTLVPDPDKTIEEGAVLPWNSGGRRLSMYAAGELGVRLDVPYRSLTSRERDIVLHGEPVRRPVTLRSGRNGRSVQLSVNYDNAVAAVERSLRSDNERTRRLVQRFLITRVCSVCHGTRLRPEALASQLGGRNLAEISALSLGELRGFVAGLPAGLPAELSRMTNGLLAELNGRLMPLLDVGLSYLTLDRAGASLSTGERQRIELTSTVRASTTGMLYVLDEPSVGLHPANVAGLRKTITALAGNGNTVVVVEHERELIRAADWVIELGPGAGASGGTLIAQGTPGQMETDPRSIMGPFLAGAAAVPRDRPARAGADGQIAIEIGDLYNLHDLTAAFPTHRLTAVAGPSGAGKTALVLDSLIPAARALLRGSALPGHVRRLDLGGIRQVVQIDASPIGQNARSTPATYSGAFDQIRRLFAESAYARRRRWKPGHFSFNTREGQCPTCRGMGHIDLDVQYLPDITIGCPTCHGARFNDATLAAAIDGLTIADVLGLSVHDALDQFADRVPVAAALRPVAEVGLGYLRLGEPTPSLSGGESQRLRIASRLRSSQRGALYVFDEPSTGLHPLDVATLVGVFDRLLEAGATIIVIDHDLDLLAAADHLIDVGPGGGPDGGHIVSAGTPADVARAPGSVTGPWLAEHLGLPEARQLDVSSHGCRPPGAWGQAELSFASGMGPLVRQLWDHPGLGAAGTAAARFTLAARTVRRIWEGSGVAFREVGVHEIREVLRLWLRGEGIRSVARLARVDRKTVRRYVAAAQACGLDRAGGEGQLGDELLGAVAERVRPHRADGHGESWAVLAAHHARLAELLDAGLTVVKAGELLAREGVVVPERTLHRYALVVLGHGRGQKPTVRVADCEPGAECQVDFGKMGLLDDLEAGRRRVVHALIFTAVYSRHCYVWLTFRQDLTAVIAGFEAAWAFFGGVFAVVIPDNMAAIVERANPLEPRLNRAFAEYAQDRGFAVDPARVRRPADKPRVERMVQFVRGSFFAGESFPGGLPGAQRAAEGWCAGRAGQRIHRTTRCRPAELFAAEEAPRLLPAPVFPYDLPVYASPKVHRDHHIEVAKALYSVPGNLIGAHVDVRADAKLVRVYHRGQLVKTHPRARPGGRVTDPADLPAHKSAYAMRDIGYLQRLADECGPAVGAYAAAVLDHPLPWTKMRQVYALLGLARKWGPARVEAACARALEAEAISVPLIGRMLERGTEGQHLPHTEPLPGMPAPRFARSRSHFAVTGPPPTGPDQAGPR